MTGISSHRTLSLTEERKQAKKSVLRSKCASTFLENWAPKGLKTHRAWNKIWHPTWNFSALLPFEFDDVHRFPQVWALPGRTGCIWFFLESLMNIVIWLSFFTEEKPRLEDGVMCLLLHRNVLLQCKPLVWKYVFSIAKQVSIALQLPVLHPSYNSGNLVCKPHSLSQTLWCHWSVCSIFCIGFHSWYWIHQETSEHFNTLDLRIISLFSCCPFPGLLLGFDKCFCAVVLSFWHFALC